MPNGSSNSTRVFWPGLTREELLERLRLATAHFVQLVPLRRVVLLGSWASGRATTSNSVDVWIVYADPPRCDAFVLVWRTFADAGVPRVEPPVYTASEAAALAPTLEAMCRDGILLYPANATDPAALSPPVE